MAVIPPYDPDEKPKKRRLDPTGRAQSSPDVHFVSGSEATDEDRMSFSDRMMLLGGIGCAAVLRFVLIAGVVAIIVLLFFLAKHA